MSNQSASLVKFLFHEQCKKYFVGSVLGLKNFVFKAKQKNKVLKNDKKTCLILKTLFLRTELTSFFAEKDTLCVLVLQKESFALKTRFNLKNLVSS